MSATSYYECWRLTSDDEEDSMIDSCKHFSSFPKKLNQTINHG